MTVARHWRCSFTLGSQSSVSVREMAFLDGSGTDLSTGGTASASSSATGFVTPDKAFDKDLGTWWSNAASELQPYLAYDHGTAVDVAQIRINFGALGGLIALESNIRWSVSDDGSTWSQPAPLRLVSGTIAASTEGTYDLMQVSDLAFIGVDGGFLPFAGSAVPSGLPTIFFPSSVAPYRDFAFGGAGKVLGTVKRTADPTNVPLKRRVRLHRERDGMLIREVWSDPVTGGYEFSWIDELETYTVLTYDYEQTYRAVVADNLTLANGGVELMA